MSDATTKSEFALRCDRCHHCIGHASVPMELVALFRPKLTVVVPRSHREEVRHRCRSCGYVNIFHPVSTSVLTPSWRGITLKQDA